MKSLSPIDQLFLWLEKPRQPMHVAGLLLFSLPSGAGEDYLEQLAKQLRQFSRLSFPFDQRLGGHPARPCWVRELHPDLEHHIRLEGLPKSGNFRELLNLVASEHSHLMDRQRPLWEFHLIEGLSENRFAVYIKIHHALMDGVSIMHLAQRMLSANPEQQDLPPLWARPSAAETAASIRPSSLWRSLGQYLEESGKQLATLPAVSRELLHTIKAGRREPASGPLTPAPTSLLNRKVTGSRRFEAWGCGLQRIRAVGKVSDTTVNDVVLAMCASALRCYLMNRDALPEQPLVAMVPVSLREEGSAGGNQVGTILASLGTHLDQPAERLRHIHQQVQSAKARYAGMSAPEITNYTALTLAPTGFHLLTGLAPKWQAFNLVISNLPGPRETCYWNGARLDALYPVSIVMDRVALNISLTSYRDRVEFGLLGCRQTLPDLQQLPDYLEEGLRDLELAAGL